MIELLNIDCMEYMATCEDNAFDLIVTDPPYGVNLEYNTYIDTVENWFDLMGKFIPEARRIGKMAIFPCGSIQKKLEWIYKNHTPDWLMAWDKGSPGHSAFIGFNDWEPLLVYGKINEVQLHDVIRLRNGEIMGDYGHPCPKPVHWFKWFYGRMPLNIKVFDPFAGSGTSAIAAHYCGHDYVGCEIDKDYYDAAVKRFHAETAQIDMFG